MVGCVGGVGAEQGYLPCLSRRQRALGVVCKDDGFAVWRPGTTIPDGDGRFPIERLRGDERGRKINGAGRQCRPKVPQFEKHLNSRSFPIHQQTTSSNKKWLTPQLQALHSSEIAAFQNADSSSNSCTPLAPRPPPISCPRPTFPLALVSTQLVSRHRLHAPPECQHPSAQNPPRLALCQHLNQDPGTP
jgi:hypothetical protein